ncbi:MAG: hypothetical protein HY040_14095 [Planctomycetes bacterium]|nr:hypothetical protein [Planctomycetota bacterium]
MRVVFISFAAFLLGGNTIAAQELPSYGRHIRPFLAKYCLECHNAKDAKGGLVLESLKDILEGSDNGAVLTPGDPEKSKLVMLLDGSAKPAMPPAKAKFHPRAEEIALVRAWIKAGAKDDSKDIKVAIPDIKPRKPVAAPVVSLAAGPTGDLLAARPHGIQIIADDGIKSDNAVVLADPITAIAISPHDSIIAIGTGRPGRS